MPVKLILIFVTILHIVVLSGCSGLLPHEEETITSPWEEFQAVKSVYDNIILNKTTLDDLKELGIDPYSTVNIKILSYLDIIKLFMPNASIKKEDLPSKIVQCIKDKVKCRAYIIDIGETDVDRYGNAFMDVFTFRRKTKVTGWHFKATLIIHNNMVVYKLWSGSPVIDKYYDSKKPLGPLQNSGNMLKEAYTY